MLSTTAYFNITAAEWDRRAREARAGRDPEFAEELDLLEEEHREARAREARRNRTIFECGSAEVARQRLEAALADLRAHSAQVAAREDFAGEMTPGETEWSNAKTRECNDLREVIQRYEKMASNVVQLRPNPTSTSPKPTVPTTVQSAATLQAKQFAEVKYVVPGYVAEGCTILAGKPKIGKSWLMLDAGLAVAGGGEVLGAKAEEGDVLYLGLEDNERRLKTRIGKILGPFAAWPARFQYATTWERDTLGVANIRSWIESVSQPRLVVVDVLARFRAPAGSQNAYDADYAAISGLQQLAAEKNLAIVIVHHLRKSAADSDPFDRVSGTLGLSGAADSVLIIDRDGTGGTVLYGRGRDIEEIETAIQLDRGRCRWQVLGAAAEVRRSDERKQIIKVMQDAGAPMARLDIARATRMAVNTVDQLLWKMTRDGEIAKSGRGVYQVATPIQHFKLPPLPPRPH
ncbi:MAG: AAA family ATPase [Variibacter sp.]